MAELQKKATRESYGEALRDLADKYPELVVLDADLAAATKTGIFKKAYPERFFDCASVAQSLCGIALKSYINIIAQMPQKVKHIFPFFGFQI